MNANNGTFGSHSNARGNAAVNTHSTPRKHYAFVNLLNIIACIAVVGLHVSSTVFSPAQDAEWTTDIAFQAAFIFAVPVFFIISGMNLL